MVSQILGAVINIVLDPVFIFGVDFLGIPAMAHGAAIATVTGQIIAAAVGFLLHHFHNKELRLVFRKFRLNLHDKDDICCWNTFYYNECAGFGADVRYEYNTESV